MTTTDDQRDALTELERLHAEGWCACQSSTLPARIENALRDAIAERDSAAEELAAFRRIINQIRPLMALRGAEAYDAPQKIGPLLEQLLALAAPANDGLTEALGIADQIAARIASGRLPAQNEHGQYVFTDKDLDFTA